MTNWVNFSSWGPQMNTNPDWSNWLTLGAQCAYIVE
jgi:hypothetical protein